MITQTTTTPITTTRDKKKETTSTTKQDNKNPATSSSSTTRHWSSAGFRNPRIVRVSRNFGGKDRHSKVCTVRGLRDRRIRLSVPTAVQLYELQDRLGLGQPSKVIDWLIDNTKPDIEKLPPLNFPPQFAPHNILHHNLENSLFSTTTTTTKPIVNDNNNNEYLSYAFPYTNFFHNDHPENNHHSHYGSLGQLGLLSSNTSSSSISSSLLFGGQLVNPTPTTLFAPQSYNLAVENNQTMMFQNYSLHNHNNPISNNNNANQVDDHEAPSSNNSMMIRSFPAMFSNIPRFLSSSQQTQFGNRHGKDQS